MSGKTRSKKALTKKIKKFRGKVPRFIRQESWRYKRLETGWRKPKGIDSKMRLKRKGYPVSPTVGYRTPRDIRGIHPSGFTEVLVYRVEDLKGLNPEIHAVRIAHQVGLRKRMEIEEAAKRFGLKILNPSRRVAEKSVGKSGKAEEKG
ncbi:MAG: 50S ribosomal protein L32e [Candidatus Hecatellales archaeon]|nr:MAG: 50S ribosomal protein L32e [Candidatus Hecatellales archaeon]